VSTSGLSWESLVLIIIIMYTEYFYPIFIGLGLFVINQSTGSMKLKPYDVLHIV